MMPRPSPQALLPSLALLALGLAAAAPAVRAGPLEDVLPVVWSIADPAAGCADPAVHDCPDACPEVDGCAEAGQLARSALDWLMPLADGLKGTAADAADSAGSAERDAAEAAGAAAGQAGGAANDASGAAAALAGTVLGLTDPGTASGLAAALAEDAGSLAHDAVATAVATAGDAAATAAALPQTAQDALPDQVIVTCGQVGLDQWFGCHLWLGRPEVPA